MKRLLAFTAALLICLSISGCVIAIPTDLPGLEIKSTTSDTVCYPLELTFEDSATGIITLLDYSYNTEKGFTDLNLPVTVTVYEDGQKVDSYEVLFDEYANLIRIRDTEIENTYDEEGRLIRSVYTEDGEVTRIIKREYNENGRLANETVCDSDEVMVSLDLYTFEGDYGSYATVDHHDSYTRCFAFSKYTYNATGWPNLVQTYDMEGNLLSLTRWIYFTHSNTTTIIE